jgi:YkoY family integral membrane protein
LETFLATISSPQSWGIIISLIILEGLLSADNALVLAVLVKHLPEKQQKKALLYGIGGAYIFRLVAILIGTTLIKIWWIKLLGATYLLWLGINHFCCESSEDETQGITYGFWRTVLAVELMDIAFSFDSILASLGVSDKVWVLWLGGILGILMMRGVAQVLLAVIKKYPQLENTAYIFIIVIGLRMLVSTFGVHVGDIEFYSVMMVTGVVSFVRG